MSWKTSIAKVCVPTMGLVLAATVLVSTPGSADAVGVSSHRASAKKSGRPVTTSKRARLEANYRVSTRAIDTRSQADVAAGYVARFAPASSVTAGWTGSTDSCTAGTTSAAAQSSMLAAVNYARALNGLDPVMLSTSLSASAQQAALIMAANNDLSHEVPTTWKCYNQVGAAGAAASNLARTLDTMTAGEAVRQYLGDPGETNTEVGHRRWLMDPQALEVGTGLTDTTNAYYVFGATSAGRADPNWTSWPSAGYFPSQLEPAGRWSISAGSGSADFSKARVTVTDMATGALLPVTAYAPVPDIAQPTLSWDVAGITATGTYRVSVTGVSGTRDSSRRYQVKMFTA